MTSVREDSFHRRSGQSLNDDLVRMTKCIMEVGPHINEVSRRTGIFRESLRYRFHKFFLDRGFVVQANLDYDKLGLRRLILVAKLAPVFEQHAVAIMCALSEMCYLAGFSQTMLEGEYFMQIVVPTELRKDCANLFEKLREIGIFSEMEVMGFEEVRSVPMKPEYYDFMNGSWSYDWPGEGVTSATLVPSGKAEAESYDLYDLLILKELDRDANQELVEIAKRLNLTHKTLQYHYRRHVLGHDLIKKYRILWQGTHYDVKTEKAASKPHTYLAIALLATGTTDSQRAELLVNLNKIPFLWYEASNPNYYAEFFVPITSYTEFLLRVSALSRRTGCKLRTSILDQSKGLRFSIAYRLFDAEHRKWRMNSTEILSRFENLMVNVNTPSGGM